MKEQQVLKESERVLDDLLGGIPFLNSRERIYESPSARFIPDLYYEVTVGKSRQRIIVEVKSLGEPRQIRYAIQQLREYLALDGDAYPVVAAPYISNDTSLLCKENGVGYIDLAGNCFLNFNKVYIERRNYPNPNVEKRELRSLFSPKASRIARVLLTNPKRSWQLQELAREASVSLGMVFKIKQRLLELEYAREERKNIMLNRPEEFLSRWAESYSFRRNNMYDYFSLGSLRETERKLSEYCQDKNIEYSLTLFSGAALVAPFARYTRGFAYVSEGIQELATSLELKEVTTGPNFSILEPYDDGVFYGSRPIKGIRVVSDVQLYVDLVNYKGRGEESAKFLLEQRLKTQW
jgi:hypothetical protein